MKIIAVAKRKGLIEVGELLYGSFSTGFDLNLPGLIQTVILNTIFHRYKEHLLVDNCSKQ